MNLIIVAIDGPSGVGKSSTSKAVARALHIPHIDTGAMYRAIAVKAMRSGVDVSDEAGLAGLAAQAHIDFDPSRDPARVLLDGSDVSAEIRQPDVSLAASAVSAVPAVRRVLVRLQQELGLRSGGVLEGRDIGTKVFPDTPFKFFLTASPAVRAERRFLELEARGMPQDRASVLAEMEQRDSQDSSRADSPLTFDDSYVLIDTSERTIAEVTEVIVERVRKAEIGVS
ncbi:MAG: (d)CMP kinase [Acidobacteriota bacterium]